MISTLDLNRNLDNGLISSPDTFGSGILSRKRASLEDTESWERRNMDWSSGASLAGSGGMVAARKLDELHREESFNTFGSKQDVCERRTRFVRLAMSSRHWQRWKSRPEKNPEKS